MTDRKWKRRTPPPDMRSLLSEAQGVGEIKSEDGSSLIDGNLLNNKQRPPRDSKGRFIQRGRSRNGSTTRNSKGDFESQDYSSDELSQESENENHLSNQNGKHSGDENGKKPLSARRTKIPNSASPKEPLEPYENSSDEFQTTSPNNHVQNYSNDSTPITKNHTPLPSEGNSQTEIVQSKKMETPAVKLEQDNQHYKNNENGEKKTKPNEVEVQDEELLLLTAFLELAKESKVVPTQPAQPVQPKRPTVNEDVSKLREVVNRKIEESKNGAHKNGSELPVLVKTPNKYTKKQEPVSDRPRRQRKQKEFSDYDSDFDDANTDLYSTNSKRKETRRPKRARNTPSNQMDDDEFDRFIEENGNGNSHEYTNGKNKPKRKRGNTVKDDDEYTDSVQEPIANGNLSSEAARPKRQRKSLPLSAVDNDDTLQVEEAPTPAPRSKLWKSENGHSHISNSNGDHSHLERKITKSNSNNSEESEEPEKKRTNVFGRVNRPRLGEIPELEHKKVFCHNKTGIIIGANIRCDCCKKMFSAGEFERHAGLLVARNPYKTIIVTESGKMLDAYRYCTCCHTTESDFWGEGPYGPRTLCASCAEKWKKGLITDIYLKQIVETSKGVECRSKSEKIAPKMTGVTTHAPSVSPVPKFHIDKFDYEQFNEYVIKKRTPVVITGLLDKFKDKGMFSFEYLKQKYYDSEISVRYQQCEKVDDSQFEVLKDANKTLGWFIDHAENPDLANDPDFDSGTTDPNKKIVMYAKDFSFGEIVPEWQSEILAHIPEFLLPYGKHDLMGYLDEATRPIVWMAYVGADDTRTPLHLDKLATIAFNLLVCGKGTKRWWLVDTSEREKLESLVSKEGGSLFKDNYWMAPHELEEAGLKMWYHEQTLGDLVIVPPMIPHTVINANGLSCAVAANLLNESVVEICWKMEQFYRTINRTSIYRIKPTVNAVIRSELAKGDAGKLSESVVKIFSEMIDQETVEGNPNAELEEGFFLCDGCSAEIFNRRYHCSQCRAGDYDLCVQCYEKFGREHFHQMILKERIPLEQLKNTLQEAQAHLFKQQKPSSPTSRVAIHNLLN